MSVTGYTRSSSNVCVCVYVYMFTQMGKDRFLFFLSFFRLHISEQ
jgi:hypothetical protein